MIEALLRVVFAGALFGALALSAFYRRRARAAGEVIERRAEGVAALVLRMGLALPLFAALLLFILYPRALAWSRLGLPDGVRLSAAAGAALCLPFLRRVLRAIGPNISETVLTKREHELVTHGPYRWVRHPLYTGSLALLLCLSLIADSWFLGLYWLAALLAFRMVVIPREEAHLTAAFGDAYVQYRRGTGALFPKFWG
jgi:protein-S-isoprenylcysteine O-methyltransferase Ste14